MKSESPICLFLFKYWVAYGQDKQTVNGDPIKIYYNIITQFGSKYCLLIHNVTPYNHFLSTSVKEQLSTVCETISKSTPRNQNILPTIQKR